MDRLDVPARKKRDRDTMRKKIIRGVLIVLTAIIVYLVVGAAAPFFKTKELEDTGHADELVERVMTDRDSPDRAKIVETNQSALEERIRLIHMARENIVLCTFDMREGESTSDILAMLYKKAEEGVRIQILVDGISGFIRMQGVPLFLTVAQHENIQIRIYNKLNPLLPWKAMGCMHDKYLIVDHTAYLLGGRNTFDYFIGEYETENMSFDREVLIYNTVPSDKESSVYELYDYFDRMWDHGECSVYGGNGISDEDRMAMQVFLENRYENICRQYPGLFEEYDYIQSTYETKGVTLLANETHIYSKEPVVFYELTELMKRAENRVILHTPYVVMDEEMQKRMKEVCESVLVTMMVNARENGDNLVASSDYTWHRKDVLDTGVSLLEYMGGVSYHGKSAVIDEDVAIVGSYNLDMRSTYVDTELMAAVRSEEVARELAGYMEELHRDCRKVAADGTEEIPRHLSEDPVCEPLTFGQKSVFRILGLAMQLFRVFV